MATAAHQPERLIVYVDGFNLYHGLHDDSGHSLLWLDLVKLAQRLRPHQQLIGVKYFTASVLNDPAAQSRQDHYIEALTSLYPTHIDVVMGRYQSTPYTCRKCGHTYLRYEEKETDVNLATSILVDSSLGLCDTVMLISADSDMAPAVRAARLINPELFIFAAFPPKRFSHELKSLMPASFVIGRGRLKNAQLPRSFAVSGKLFSRPAKWE